MKIETVSAHPVKIRTIAKMRLHEKRTFKYEAYNEQLIVAVDAVGDDEDEYDEDRDENNRVCGYRVVFSQKDIRQLPKMAARMDIKPKGASLFHEWEYNVRSHKRLRDILRGHDAYVDIGSYMWKRVSISHEDAHSLLPQDRETELHVWLDSPLAVLVVVPQKPQISTTDVKLNQYAIEIEKFIESRKLGMSELRRLAMDTGAVDEPYSGYASSTLTSRKDLIANIAEMCSMKELTDQMEEYYNNPTELVSVFLAEEECTLSVLQLFATKYLKMKKKEIMDFRRDGLIAAINEEWLYPNEAGLSPSVDECKELFNEMKKKETTITGVRIPTEDKKGWTE